MTSTTTFYGCGPAEAALVRELAPGYRLSATVVEADLGATNVELAAGAPTASISHRERLTAPLLAALRDVGVLHLSTRSIGVDHIDLAAADRVGLSVDNVAYSPDSVADYTLMLVLMALRRARATVLRAEGPDGGVDRQPGRELRDLTVGVVGTGRIGTAVLDRLRGFGCRVLAYDHRPAASAAYVSLPELLQRSDVVTLHTPLTAETRHLLDARRIDQMPEGAVVVNTARGALVDTEALVGALERGRLGGAGLDVVEAGSDELRARLHRLPNVVLTPHTAYFTDHALRDAVEASLRSCARFAGALQRG